MGGDQFKSFFRGLPVSPERFVDRDGWKYVAEMAIVALVLVITFLLDKCGNTRERLLLLLFRQLPEKDGLPAVHDHGKRFVGFLHHFKAVAASQCLDSSLWMVTFRNPAAVRCVFSS